MADRYDSLQTPELDKELYNGDSANQLLHTYDMAASFSEQDLLIDDIAYGQANPPALHTLHQTLTAQCPAEHQQHQSQPQSQQQHHDNLVLPPYNQLHEQQQSQQRQQQLLLHLPLDSTASSSTLSTATTTESVVAVAAAQTPQLQLQSNLIQNFQSNEKTVEFSRLVEYEHLKYSHQIPTDDDNDILSKPPSDMPKFRSSSTSTAASGAGVAALGAILMASNTLAHTVSDRTLSVVAGCCASTLHTAATAAAAPTSTAGSSSSSASSVATDTSSSGAAPGTSTSAGSPGSTSTSTSTSQSSSRRAAAPSWPPPLSPSQCYLTDPIRLPFGRPLIIPSRLWLPDNERRQRQPYTIHIEGVMGSGKTRLMYFLAHGPYAKYIEFVHEPVDKWSNFHGIDLMSNFYNQPHVGVAPFQSYAFNTLLENHLKPTTKPIKIMERSIHSCIRFARFQHQQGYLDATNLNILEHLYLTANKYLTVDPDMLFYMDTTIEQCLHNVNVRARDNENIDAFYLTQIKKMHTEWIQGEINARKEMLIIPQIIELVKVEHLIADILKLLTYQSDNSIISTTTRSLSPEMDTTLPIALPSMEPRMPMPTMFPRRESSSSSSPSPSSTTPMLQGVAPMDTTATDVSTANSIITTTAASGSGSTN